MHNSHSIVVQIKRYATCSQHSSASLLSSCVQSCRRLYDMQDNRVSTDSTAVSALDSQAVRFLSTDFDSIPDFGWSYPSQSLNDTPPPSHEPSTSPMSYSAFQSCQPSVSTTLFREVLGAVANSVTNAVNGAMLVPHSITQVLIKYLQVPQQMLCTILTMWLT